LLLPSKDVTISFVKRRGCLDNSGYRGVAHFNVRVKPVPTAAPYVSIVEDDNGDSADNLTMKKTNTSSKATCVTGDLSQVVCRPVGDASIMHLPSKRPRSYKLAVYESLQWSKRPALEKLTTSNEVFDDKVIELPLKR
jgi:hypothetical protein